MRKLVATVLLTVGLAWGSAASAATLTLLDTRGVGASTWTLEVEDGCQFNCDVTLSVLFNNAYTGQYIDAVQWVVSQPPVSPTSVTLDSTTAGAVADWDFDIDESLNANQCGGGASDAVCGAWISGGTAGGFGPLGGAGSTLTWAFTVNWDALLTVATSGNIRAAFNTSEGKNFNIFSPGGGTFTTDDPNTTDEPTTTDDPQTTDEPTTTDAPEPAILGLLGAGLLAASRRMRRRKL